MSHVTMKPSHIFLAIVVSICWGINFAASKFTLLHFPPFFTIFLRFMLTVIALAPFMGPKPASARELSILAFLMVVLHFTLVFGAIWMGLDLSSAVVAVQLGVPFSCLLSTMFLGDKLGPWRTFGMVVAFMGVVIVAGTPSVVEHSLAFVIAMIGAFGWAAGNVYMKKLSHVKAIPLLGWSSLYALPQLTLLTFLFESNHLTLLQTVPLHSALGLTYTVIFSTLVAYGLWYWLLGKYDVSLVTPYSLLVPIAGFSAGHIFFHEELGWKTLIGGALTILGVAVITIRKPKLVEQVDRA